MVDLVDKIVNLELYKELLSEIEEKLELQIHYKYPKGIDEGVQEQIDFVNFTLSEAESVLKDKFFLIFLFLMRIQELRELSFKLSYLPLVYPTFFLCVFLSHRSFSFRVLEKVGIRECKVFRSKYYPQGWRFLPKTGGLTLHSRPIPELPLRPERK